MNKQLQQQFQQYSDSHQNPINQAIHNIAVPLIYLSVLGLFWAIPLPTFIDKPHWLNLSCFATVITLAFYITRSLTLAFGILILSALSIALFIYLESLAISVAYTAIAIFIIAWIAQFIGHAIEGKKPSFFEDMQFLLIGPGWVIAKLYRRLHIPL